VVAETPKDVATEITVLIIFSKFASGILYLYDVAWDDRIV